MQRLCFSRRSSLWSVATIMTAISPAISAPVIYDIGTLPNCPTSQATALSSDGTTVIGLANQTPFTGRAFRWTVSGGIGDLGTLPGSISTRAYGVNADGSVVVGTSADRSFRWTSATGMVDLGTSPGGGASVAKGVNGDGTMVVGYDNTNQRSYIWTPATGIQLTSNFTAGIGVFQEYSEAISADGSMIVGRAVSSQLGDQLGGIRATALTELGFRVLPPHSFATAVTPTGTYVTGYRNTGGAGSSAATTNAIRWIPGQNASGLLGPPGLPYSHGRDISADGSIIVGDCFNQPNGTIRAMMWTQGTGMVNLNTYLPTIGVDLTGWILTDATGISDDGRTLTGTGTFNGVQRAWYITGVPTPGTTLPLLLGTLVASRRRRSK